MLLKVYSILIYHYLEVNQVDIIDSLYMISFSSSKQQTFVFINAGEGEDREWRRSSSLDIGG